jgi:hypothetical protein
MIFADSDVRKPVRTLANEFGVDFEPIVNLNIMIKWLHRDSSLEIMKVNTQKSNQRMLFFQETSLNLFRPLQRESFLSLKEQLHSMVLAMLLIRKMNSFSQF